MAHPDPATPSRSLVRRRLAVRVLLAAAVVGVIYFRLLPKQVDVAEVWATPGWLPGPPADPGRRCRANPAAHPRHRWGMSQLSTIPRGAHLDLNQRINRGVLAATHGTAVGPCSWWCRLGS